MEELNPQTMQILAALSGTGIGPAMLPRPAPGMPTEKSMEDLYKKQNPNVPAEPIFPGLYDHPMNRILPGSDQYPGSPNLGKVVGLDALMPMIKGLGGAVTPDYLKEVMNPAPIQDLPSTPQKVPSVQPDIPGAGAMAGVDLATNLLTGGGAGAGKALFLGPIMATEQMARRTGKQFFPGEWADAMAAQMAKAGGIHNAFDFYKTFTGPDKIIRYEVPDIGTKLVPLDKKFAEGWGKIAFNEGERLMKIEHPIVENIHERLNMPPIMVQKEAGIPGRLGTADLKSGQITIHADPDALAGYTHGTFIPMGASKGFSGVRHDPMAAILHEVQHLVQKKEGTAGGTSPLHSPFLSDFYKVLGEPDLSKTVNEGVQDEIRKLINMQTGKQQMTQKQKDTLNAAFDVYERAAGEVEARNVEKRYLDPTWYSLHPTYSMDFPMSKQVLPEELLTGLGGRFFGGKP